MKFKAASLITCLLVAMSFFLVWDKDQAQAVAGQNNAPLGAYIIALDNKVEVKQEKGSAAFKSIYAAGIALDKQVLIVPANSFTQVDDAENKKYLFYYLDINKGLVALISTVELLPVKCAAEKSIDPDTNYIFAYAKDGKFSFIKSRGLSGIDQDKVYFVFKNKNEFCGILHVQGKYRRLITVAELLEFNSECLDEIKTDGGVEKIIKKFSRPQK